MVTDQTLWANRTAWRDFGWVFFAIGIPVGLYVLMSSMYGDSGFQPAGLPFATFFACGMAVYGISITGFLNMPTAIVKARDQGVLKRLRGTPLAPVEYLAGRMAAVLWLSLLTAALVFAIGLAFFSVSVALAGVPMAVVVLLLGTVSLTACGFALAALVPTARAMAVVGLAVLLPLAFLSDLFVIGNTPAWIATFASLFPLRHFVYALAGSLDPSGPHVDWLDLATMIGWLVLAMAVAVRRWRWEPR